MLKWLDSHEPNGRRHVSTELAGVLCMLTWDTRYSPDWQLFHNAMDKGEPYPEFKDEPLELLKSRALAITADRIKEKLQAEGLL